MEIREQLFTAPVSNSEIEQSKKTVDVDKLLSITRLIENLNLNQDGDVFCRDTLRQTLAFMEPEKRLEIIQYLKEFIKIPNNSQTVLNIEEKLLAAEGEVNSSNRVDRLLDLLFMLIMLMGGLVTERTSQSAKFSQIAVRQAVLSGEKSVQAAQSNFAGALTGFFASVAVASVGFEKYRGATRSQVKNINENFRGAADLRKQKLNTVNGQNTQSPSLNASSQHEKTGSLDKKVKNETNQPSLVGEDKKALNGSIQGSEAEISSLELTGQENTYKFTQQQVAGQIISSMSSSVSAIASSGAAVEAAENSSGAKIIDAEGIVASEVAHNADQLSQHSLELLGRMFALIVSAAEQNRTTLDAISQSIKS